MNANNSMELIGDPVMDDPSFNPKRWTFNTLPTIPPWPLGTEPNYPDEKIARLLTQWRGEWITERSIAGIYFVNPDNAPPHYFDGEIQVCRNRYGMIIEEQLFPEGVRFRWNGKYDGHFDSRRMTDDMRAEEKKLLQLRVELQANKATWLPALKKSKAQKRNWLARKRNYQKRVKRLRDKFRRMNPEEEQHYEPYGVGQWPLALKVTW